MPSEIDRDELQRLLAAGAALVEVLPRDSYEEEHLPGAINIPLKELNRETVGSNRPYRAGDRLLLRRDLRPQLASRVAARSTRLRQGLRLRRWQGRLGGRRTATRRNRCGRPVSR